MTVVAFSGGIAVGKTTLVKRLGKLFDEYRTVEEDPTENIFLDDFYKDRKRWSFHSRVAMLDLFYKRFSRFERPYDYLILDRFIFELDVFAKIQVNSGNLSEKEYLLYESVYQRFCDGVRWPDVVVRVRCDLSEAERRMRARARDFEKDVNTQYLLAVERAYDIWILQIPKKIKIFDFDNTENSSDEHLVQIFQNVFRG
jgi:deoxyadenosine/deoxycytidine kinase